MKKYLTILFFIAFSSMIYANSNDGQIISDSDSEDLFCKIEKNGSVYICYLCDCSKLARTVNEDKSDQPKTDENSN
ncbi:MAG: hypothetical protein KBS98_05540 [Flavobacterium sp.]|nr:hypothetical protein [Candidatus Neoflavobacterium equi]